MLWGACCRVSAEIVLFQNFREMREIVFSDVALKILKHMIYAGRFATMVEGSLIIGEHQNQRA